MYPKIKNFRFGIILFLCFIAASCKQNEPKSVYSVKGGCWCELKEKPYIYTPGFYDLNPRPRIIEPSGDGRIKILKMELDDDVIVGDTIVDPVFEKLLGVKDQAFQDSLITLIDIQYNELLDSALVEFLSSASAFNQILDDSKIGRLRISVSEDKLAKLIMEYSLLVLMTKSFKILLSFQKSFLNRIISY